MWHDSFTHVTWLVHKCDVTRSHAWHDSFVDGTELIHTRSGWYLNTITQHCDKTRAYIWHDSFTLCDMTHSHMGHDSLTRIVCDICTRPHSHITCEKSEEISSESHKILYIQCPTLWIMYKYSSASPTDAPFGSWSLTCTKYFHPTILVGWKWQSQLGWVISSVQADFVRRIRMWSIWSSSRDFVYLYPTMSKTTWNLAIRQWTPEEHVYRHMHREHIYKRVHLANTFIDMYLEKEATKEIHITHITCTPEEHIYRHVHLENTFIDICTWRKRVSSRSTMPKNVWFPAPSTSDVRPSPGTRRNESWRIWCVCL